MFNFAICASYCTHVNPSIPDRISYRLPYKILLVCFIPRQVGEVEGIPTPLKSPVPVRVAHSGLGRLTNDGISYAQEDAIVSDIQRTPSLNPEVAVNLR